MQWLQGAPNPAADPISCSCCSGATAVALSLNSKIFYLSPLRPFPKAIIAILLPVIFGDPPANILALWMTHNTRALGVGLTIVYSQNASATFDRNGVLRTFYEFNSGRGVVIVNVPEIGTLETHYYNQHFVINNAMLRSMGAIDYLGSLDADEFIEIPPGYNMTAYLRKALQCQVSPTNASICTGHHFAAVGIGSVMISSYVSSFDFNAKLQFCRTGSIYDDYSYLPDKAECIANEQPPNQVCASKIPCLSPPPSFSLSFLSSVELPHCYFVWADGHTVVHRLARPAQMVHCSSGHAHSHPLR